MKKILGMGNALVDIMIPLESDTILEMLELPKGSMQLVDKDRSNSVLSALEGYKKSLSAGGSAANTIHGLAMLGARTGYIGVVGEDELGGFFVRDLIQAGVDPHMIHSKQETGRAVALVTPDSERTFATFLGAAIELSDGHLAFGDPDSLSSPDIAKPEMSIFKDYGYFHIEGYLVQNHELIRQAVKLAREHGLIVSLDMASYNVVEANRDFLLSIITEFVDIVFANEDEAGAFCGDISPEQMAEKLGEYCAVAAVKLGKEGSCIKDKNGIVSVPAELVKAVDTTGAGDLWQAGFLYGYLQGRPMADCARFGSITAAEVVQVIGADIPDARWAVIRKKLQA